MANKVREISTSQQIPTRPPLRLLHELIIARKYVKPEKIGSILLNPAWRTDNSRSLWEVVQSSPEADESLQTELQPGWILVTPRNSGVFLEDVEVTRDDGRPEMEERFLLHAKLILRIIPWTLGGSMPIPLGKRVFVAPDDPSQKKTTGLIIRPELIEKRPVTGIVTSVGPEVEDSERLVVGARVLYSLYAGTDLTVNGERQTVMLESQIDAVIPEDEEVEVV